MLKGILFQVLRAAKNEEVLVIGSFIQSIVGFYTHAPPSSSTVDSPDKYSN